MTIATAVMAAWMALQVSTPYPALSENAHALAGLEEVGLVVMAIGVDQSGAGPGQALDGKRLPEEAMSVLAAAGVPIVRAYPNENRPLILIEIAIYPTETVEERKLTCFEITLSLFDKVTVIRNGEAVNAVTWKAGSGLEVALSEELAEQVSVTQESLCHRFAALYRAANGIR